jgi:hypothetical protein
MSSAAHLHRQLSKVDVVLVDVLRGTLHDKLTQRLAVVGELLGLNLRGSVCVGEGWVWVGGGGLGGGGRGGGRDANGR